MAAIDLPGLTSRTTASPMAQLLGQGGEMAQDGAIPGDFAAMLAASQTHAATPASLLNALPAPATGKAGGKPGGKILPDGLPLADMAMTGELPETEVDDTAAPVEPVLPVPAQPPIVAAPQLALPANPVETPRTDETPGRAAASQGAPAYPGQPLNQPMGQPMPLPVMAQAARIMAGQDGLRPATRATQANGQVANVQIKAVGIAFELPAAMPAQAIQAVQAAQTPQAALPGVQAQPALAPVAALLPRANTPVAVPAEAAMPARRAAIAAADLSAAERPVAPAMIEAAAEGMALRTDMAPAPVPAPQAASAPAPAAGPAPHDFAALVDRLVEARDAALATQAPQVVQSTLRHADFGQVSIRFETAGDGLSASLSSPDPDFARAVQSSAAAGQGSLNADQQGSQPRQDGNSGQPSFAQSQQRSPGQQASGAEARWRDAPAAAEPRSEGSDKPAAAQGRGIYA